MTTGSSDTGRVREYRLVANGCLRYRNVSMAKVRAYHARWLRACYMAGVPAPAFRIYSVRRKIT